MSRYIVYSVFAIIIIVGMYVLLVLGGNYYRSTMAEKSGAQFVDKLYAEYRIVGKSCQSQDNDGDSYVSCDFRLMNTQNVERVVHLQCPTIFKSIFGESCKESRIMTQ